MAGRLSSRSRKLYYNIIVTLTSAAVAFLVGGVEALGLVNDHFGFTGSFWDLVASLNSHFGVLGYADGRPVCFVLGRLRGGLPPAAVR